MPRRKGSRAGWTQYQLLQLFGTKVDELRGRRLVQSGTDWRLTVRGTRHVVREYEFSEPDEQDWRSFCLQFPQFCQKSDALHVPKVCRACQELLIDEDVKKEVGQLHSAWNHTLQGKTGSILVIDGAALVPEHAIDLLFYGDYFHLDREKAAELETMQELKLPLYRMLVLEKMRRLIEIVVSLGNIVTFALENGLLTGGTAQTNSKARSVSNADSSKD